jgi:hypothetical protein
MTVACEGGAEILALARGRRRARSISGYNTYLAASSTLMYIQRRGLEGEVWVSVGFALELLENVPVRRLLGRALGGFAVQPVAACMPVFLLALRAAVVRHLTRPASLRNPPSHASTRVGGALQWDAPAAVPSPCVLPTLSA